MRRALPLTTLALVAALALTSCASAGSSDETADPTPSASASPSAPVDLGSIEVGSDGPFPTATGAFGEKPALTFPSSVPSDSLQVSVLTPGDGRTVEVGDLLAANVLSQVWGGDELDSSYDRGEAVTFPVGTGQVIPGWDAGLVGQKVGSRVLLSVPPELAYGEEGVADARIPGSVTLVFVFDIVGAYPADVGGDADATPTAEATSVVPLVRGELGSTTSISVPEGAPEPTEPSTTVLAEGSGEPVVAGAVVVQYAWASWDNAQGESTWVAGAPAVLQVQPDGPFDGLTGVPMGSRVLLQVPATDTSAAVAIVVDLIDQLAATS